MSRHVSEDSISKFGELSSDTDTQLQRFLDLLIDLRIIDPPEDQKAEEKTKDSLTKNRFTSLLNLVSPSVTSDSSVTDPSIEAPPQVSEKQFVKPHPKTTVSQAQQSNSTNTLSKYLPELLTALHLTKLDCRIENTEQQLSKLEHQLSDPEMLINLLLPWIAELLHRKVIESQEDIVQAIAPIIDRVIYNRAQQDMARMGSVLAPILPPALAEQVRISPGEIASAIAPTIGQAIKEQIVIEQDKVVDALYPIIGNTIGKYLAETIHAINQQIENTLSVEGIKRKIRAKVQGISEAELLLQEVMPFKVQAIFLIHKASGLLISEVQHDQSMEAEMVAGMLTAIRSFVNDCIARTGTSSELDAINYGTAKIMLEVAGYCYLAVVVEGTPPQFFLKQLRQTLTQLVRNFGKSIEQFDGDSATVPTAIHSALAKLKSVACQQQKQPGKLSPLLLIGLVALSAAALPWSFFQYRNRVIHHVETTTATALAAVPELSVYRLIPQVQRNQLKLTGRVPNAVLRLQAEQIAHQAAPNWSINNAIVAVEVPPDPVLSAAEVQRVTKILNRMDGVAVAAQYIDNRVVVRGNVNYIEDVDTVAQAYEQIPGVKTVSSGVQIEIPQLETRFYFEPTSATLKAADLKTKIFSVILFLNQHPTWNLKIIGYSNSTSRLIEPQALALERARAVQIALAKQGIDPNRLQVIGTTDLPPGIDVVQPLWLSQCVVLEIVLPTKMNRNQQIEHK